MDPLPPPSDTLRTRFKLAPRYTRCALVGPLPVLGSALVRDTALREAAWLIENICRGRNDILSTLAERSVRVAVIAVDERTVDIPEHSDLEPASYWNRRARGLGATPDRPAVSAGEENLLGIDGDPYRGESILIHEFAHAIAGMALPVLSPKFPSQLADCHRRAVDGGLWKGTYAATNPDEYWAEGVQCWFDCNQPRPDKSHNGIWDRKGLQRHDPRLHDLIGATFPERRWKWIPSAKRLGVEHLAGWDPRSSKPFRW